MYSLHLTHLKWTHTRSSGQPLTAPGEQSGGSVPCSRTPQSWYWTILPPPTIPAGPEIRTHNLPLTSPTRYPLGHDCPQGCVLSPLLYSLYTHDCVSSHRSTSIIKFADDTVVLGLISNNDETAYLDEVERLTSWCQDNCLSLNVSKTKELIVDFRKRHLQPYTPLVISGTPVERVSSFKYPRCKHLRGPDLDYTLPNTG